MIKKLTSKLIYENKWTKVYEDTFQMPSGSEGLYAYFERQNGIGAVVLDKDNRVLLLNQYRYPIKGFQWNIPGGGVEEGESLEEAVKREVLEESGLRVEIIRSLGRVYPQSSITSQYINLYLCKTSDELQLDIERGEDDEWIKDIKFFEMDELLKMIDLGELTDASSGNAIQIADRYLRSNNKQ